MFGYDNDTDTNTFLFLSWSAPAGALINAAEYRSKSYGPCAWSLAPTLPPTPFRRSVEKRLLSSSMTASLAPWLSNTDLISGPGMQAGLNSRHLTRTQADFGIIKANILTVIQHHFTCTEVGVAVRVSENNLSGFLLLLLLTLPPMQRDTLREANHM